MDFLTRINGIAVTTTNMILGMNKCASYESKSKYHGATVPWSKDPIRVQVLPMIQGSPFDKRNPQKLFNAAGNSICSTQTYKKGQEQGSQVPRVRIKIKHSSTEYTQRRPSEKTLDKKPSEKNQGLVTCTRINPPIVAAGELPSHHVLEKGMPTQSSAGPKVGIGKIKVQVNDLNLEETKRKLHGAYQEVENAKKKRAIQVVEMCEIEKQRDSWRTPMTMSTVSKTTLTKSINHVCMTPSMKQIKKSHHQK
ncbi:hypothetical protein BS78_03G123900 [Paspalum vaginatum]|nr:hypothetical protein BS78_03G123900 [Paspalum vaginatum]